MKKILAIKYTMNDDSGQFCHRESEFHDKEPTAHSSGGVASCKGGFFMTVHSESRASIAAEIRRSL